MSNFAQQFTMRHEEDEEFQQLFKEHYPRLFYYALQITHDYEASRDIVSETFARVWGQWGQVDMARVEVLLGVAVRRRCVDHLRHLTVRSEYLQYYLHAVDECYVDTDESLKRQRQVDVLMAELSEPTKTIMRKCYLEHKKYDVVAAEMHIHHDTVKRHVMKALRTLREKFSGKNPYDLATDL